jgi:hypothetical protein
VPRPAGWVHAAFEPATGQVCIQITEKRDSRGHIRLIEQVVQQYRSDRRLLIEGNRSMDNRSIHTSKQTRRALTAWPEIQVQLLPKATPSEERASTEPHRDLVETTPEPGIEGPPVCINGGTGAGATEQALRGAFADWNAHPRPYRWKKRPQQQVVLDQPTIDGRAPQ